MRHFITVLLILVALACGESGTGPTTPAEPKGKLLVFDQIATVYVVDLATGESREVSVEGEPFSWVSPVFDEGANVVIGGGNGLFKPAPGVRQLDLASGTITTLVDGIQSSTTSLAPDGKTLMFGGSGWRTIRFALYTLELGSTAEPEVRWVAEPHQSIGDLRWLPDQSGLVGNHYDHYPGTVQMIHFNVVTGMITPITEPGPANMTRTLDVSPDGHTIAFNTHTGELRFITLNGEPAAGYPTHLRGLSPAFSPDGRLLAWSRFKDGSNQMDGIWFYRFSDGEMWRALPEGSPLTWLRDWG